MHTTPVSLLQRLKDTRAAADWSRFVGLYSPLLLYWAQRLGLQEADAADLAQDVLTRLWQEIGSYQRRDGSRFRAWLWTVTLNKFRERARRRTPEQATGEDMSDPCNAVEELVADEYNAYLVGRALELMRSEFATTTWQACWAFVVDGRPAIEVAAGLGITANAVYLSKARVLRRLREELAGMWE